MISTINIIGCNQDKITINRQQVYKILNPTTQTKRKMENELKDFVLNQEVPDTPRSHRSVYIHYHPNEILLPTDIIHHINGNHDDNRIDNLEKLNTHREHSLKHLKLWCDESLEETEL